MNNAEEIKIAIFIKTSSDETIKTILDKEDVNNLLKNENSSIKTGSKITINNINYSVKNFRIDRTEFANFKVNGKPINYYLTIIVE